MVTIIVPFPSGIQIDTLACSFLVLANPPRRYNVKVAHPLMVKAIAYAKVKTDKVDAMILADLLRTDMIPECYIPNEDIRNLRDLARRRHYFVNTRTMFKNKVHVELRDG
ncbi:MAG: transposase [Candidatus Nitrosopolaris sp.]|jgi:transposase